MPSLAVSLADGYGKSSTLLRCFRRVPARLESCPEVREQLCPHRPRICSVPPSKFRRHYGDADVHLLLAGCSHHPGRSCFSAYYVGGDAEKVIGRSAPWFVLAVMLFSYAVRALYIESSSMFVRGGVYRVVKEAMGGKLAKLSVSALLFDYVLTGPISAVSAGLYLSGFLTDTFHHLGYNVQVPTTSSRLLRNPGHPLLLVEKHSRDHESSQRALQIMKITTVMVVMLIIWCLITIAKTGAHLPPLPSAATCTTTRNRWAG